jgi:biopolymer transport protein ExbB/TolQ
VSDDPAVAVMAWLAATVVVAVGIIILLVLGALVMIARALRVVLHAGRNLIYGPPLERELRQVSREQNSAISEIVAIRHAAERQMREIARRPRRF